MWFPPAAGLRPSASPVAFPRSQSPLLLAAEQMSFRTSATFTHTHTCTNTVDPSSKWPQIWLQSSVSWIPFSPLDQWAVPSASKQVSCLTTRCHGCWLGLPGPSCSQLTSPWVPPVPNPGFWLPQYLASKCQVLLYTWSGLMVASNHLLMYTHMVCTSSHSSDWHHRHMASCGPWSHHIHWNSAVPYTCRHSE